jgi:thiamine pyrophosphate-dependent acetolactate synthase large subunit-like protein
MATIEQLEQQKQGLINSLNQILNDPNIPINDKMPIVKELSRAIANISEQINRQTPEKKPEVAKKEEIKLIRKEKKELQPTQIPKKAEEAKWRMADLIKVIKLDLSKIDYIETTESMETYVNWDKFWGSSKVHTLK